MEIQSLKIVYFSPTGTTKAVVQAVARGINQSNIEFVDITKPDARKRQLVTSENELLVVAVPVYMGRVPALLSEYLHSIKAQNTPTVCIAVYGNRVYDDALLELKDILKERGCVPIACAAFLGEHSFSSDETPIAEARPDAKDLDYAKLFGHKVSEKLRNMTSINQTADISVPGNFPYGGVTELWNVDFIEVSDKCTLCGICAQVCPVSAIDTENTNLIDIEKCITCCACIKSCPQNARTMKDSLVKEAAARLSRLYQERKEPVCFL